MSHDKMLRVQGLTYTEHKYDLIALYAGACAPWKPSI